MTQSMAIQPETETAGHVVEVVAPDGAGPYVVVCEHASCAIPIEFDNLGLSPEALQSHIAWDLGARAVAGKLASELGATLVAPRVSRLIYDCNRRPGAPSAIPEKSEIYAIPGNAGIDGEGRARRKSIYYEPFRQTLSDVIDKKMGAGKGVALITIHSFTPVFNGVERQTEIGIIHDKDARLADGILSLGEQETGLRFSRNEPYGPEDGVTFTLCEHGVARHVPNVMIEIRNDLIADENSQREMAERLARLIKSAVAEACRKLSPGNFPCCTTGS